MSEVMLGINWLIANKATWEVAKSRIRLEGHYYQLMESSESHNWCRKVVPIKNATVFLRSEMNGLTQVVYRDIRNNNTSGLIGTEPTLIRPSLNVSRTLI
jgi:hypothetical protein